MTVRDQIIALARENQTLSCSSFASIEGRPDCCGSCHEDEEYGYDLSEVEIEIAPGEIRRAFVCCKVSEWLSRALDTPGDT